MLISTWMHIIFSKFFRMYFKENGGHYIQINTGNNNAFKESQQNHPILKLPYLFLR
jgi:hypothetical protein